MSTKRLDKLTNDELQAQVGALGAALQAHNAKVTSGAPPPPGDELGHDEMEAAARHHASRAHQLLAEADEEMSGYLLAGVVPSASHRGLVALGHAHAMAAIGLAQASQLVEK